MRVHELLLLVLTACLLCCKPAACEEWPLKEALSYCEQFEDLYQGIYNDLKPWASTGIDRATMALSLDTYTSRVLNKGIALAFLNGTAYVVEGNLDTSMSHHANIAFTYMQVMLELQRLFGTLIPDLEFVLATSDRPMVRLNSTPPHPPVFRFCGSKVHADIQIPIFHFYTKRYTQNMLDKIPEINAQYPWAEKREVLFGRFANYLRYIVPNEPALARLGTGGKNICKDDSSETASCRVRHHFLHWAARHPTLLDVKSSPKVAMSKHAGYKYLLHLDGQALSSRLDSLLPLNSLVFKESSGYTSFYHHLLQPKVHYIPVWQKTPDDILAAVEWAKRHDEAAKKIAANGQEFAKKYLTKRARTCYWFKLLREYAKLLKYKVSPAHELQEQADKLERKNKGKDAVPAASPCPAPGTTEAPHLGKLGCWVTVEQYLDTFARSFEGGRYLTSYKEKY